MSRLSIIIPTLNEERHVGALLSDVAAQTRKSEEVLVLDAGHAGLMAAPVAKEELWPRSGEASTQSGAT